MRGLLVLALVVGAGCSLQPTREIVTAEGYNGPSDPAAMSTYAMFKTAFQTSAGSPRDPGLARDMVRISSELEFQLCSEFFASGGREQQYLLFTKDLVALMGTIATGVLGATRASPAAIAWLGLGSASGISAINTYQRNFLFSEDNIQAVETLTLNALDVGRKDASATGFVDGVSTLVQIQAICQPQKILSLVRDAIRAGKPENTGASPGFAAVETMELGRLVNDGQSLDGQQLQALYWYFLGTARTPAANAGASLGAIKATLSTLRKPPIDGDGKLVPGYPTAAVIAALQSSAPELRRKIESNIDAASLQSRAPFSAAAGAVAAPRPPVLPSLGEAPAGRRIDIQIR